MIVDLSSISKAARSFNFTLGPGRLESIDPAGQVLETAGTVRVGITIHRAGSRFVLDGNLSGFVRARCDRCLESFDSDLTTGFQVYLAFQPEGQSRDEVELREEDMGVDFITGDEVDLALIAREQILLAMPMKILCDERCAGLCAGCGFNLNTEPCVCRGRET